jgi:hypothetical protein
MAACGQVRWRSLESAAKLEEVAEIAPLVIGAGPRYEN